MDKGHQNLFGLFQCRIYLGENPYTSSKGIMYKKVTHSKPFCDLGQLNFVFLCNSNIKSQFTYIYVNLKFFFFCFVNHGTGNIQLGLRELIRGVSHILRHTFEM